MEPVQGDYHSYLLRMWRVQGEEGVDWRASLEDVQTDELYGFPDLAARRNLTPPLIRLGRQDCFILAAQPV